MWFLAGIALLVLQSLSPPAKLIPESFSPTAGCTTTSVIYPVQSSGLITTVYSNTVIATSSVDCHGCCEIQLFALGHTFLALSYPTTVTAATPTTRTRTLCIQSPEASCTSIPTAINGGQDDPDARVTGPTSMANERNETGTSTSCTSAVASINSTLKISPHPMPKQTSSPAGRPLPPGVSEDNTEATFTTVAVGSKTTTPMWDFPISVKVPPKSTAVEIHDSEIKVTRAG